MFHTIMAIGLLVRDLARCTAFYRDTLGLEVRESESTADSVSFQMGNIYFFLLEVSGATHMVSSQVLDLSIEGRPRVLLAAGVADVDAAYEELSARGVPFLRPPTDQSWGCVQPTLPILKATSGRSTVQWITARGVSEAALAAFFGHRGKASGICETLQGCVRMKGGISTWNATLEISRSTMKPTAQAGPS